MISVYLYKYYVSNLLVLKWSGSKNKNATFKNVLELCESKAVMIRFLYQPASNSKSETLQMLTSKTSPQQLVESSA